MLTIMFLHEMMAVYIISTIYRVFYFILFNVNCVPYVLCFFSYFVSYVRFLLL